MLILLWLIFASLLLSDVLEETVVKPLTNDRPIIGVLSQESYPYDGTSYIAASYVKYLEGAGARVVPIMIKKDISYYKRIFNSINGILFPGGGADLATSGYASAGRILHSLAVQANKEGDYFPLWGTCLGMELISCMAIGKNVLCHCDAENMAMPLQFKNGFRKSRMYSSATDDIISILTTEHVTAEFHHRCLTEQNFTAYGLDKLFSIISFNQAADNITYISSMESIQFPFYGAQFHPEKNLYEWTQKAGHDKIPHTAGAIQAAQYFARFFVNEARKNFHKFEKKNEEQKYLIYKYRPNYTANTFEQTYFFPLE